MVQTCDLYADIFGLPGAAPAGGAVWSGSRRELNTVKSASQIPLRGRAYRAATKAAANSWAVRHMVTRRGSGPVSIAVPGSLDLAPSAARKGSEEKPLHLFPNLAEASHQLMIVVEQMKLDVRPCRSPARDRVRVDRRVPATLEHLHRLG